jgi:hypothetical protein
VLVEADPAGGDLAARFGLGPGPGLASMAVAARHNDESPEPSSWARVLPLGVAVVPAAPGAAAAAALAALAGHGSRLLTVLADSHPVVVVDAGRWTHGSPADELLSQCQVVLLVVRPVLEQVRQCEARVGPLRRLVGDVRLLLVEAAGGWPAAEVGAALGLPVAGVLPEDVQGAGVLSGRLVPRNGFRARGLSSWVRLPLPRACHSLARALAPDPHGTAPDQATPPPADGSTPTLAGGWPAPPAGEAATPQVGSGRGVRP